ncbi:hypothetical protein TRFO_40735 [Tritrichomonas foetus]|uniref:Uncharacterized protein n=1 Tax=Tritrichomonas foetus TaxID=1144522 RepID=A0A1J4J647_9EUKA|nr:hypothetical protein TRFO_40735 [Tritrichomonas foetus]|eukprot:OHS92925.1 hypothetical protein TRFO_40735 [Tritrichomonas foetus]
MYPYFQGRSEGQSFNFQRGNNLNIDAKKRSNPPQISIERPKKQPVEQTTPFSIGIGQTHIVTAPVNMPTSQEMPRTPSISIEKRNGSKLNLFYQGNQNCANSVSNLTDLSSHMQNRGITIQRPNSTLFDRPNMASSEEQKYDDIVKLPIKEFYTPDEISMLKPLCPPLKRLQSPGFITLLTFFNEKNAYKKNNLNSQNSSPTHSNNYNSNYNNSNNYNSNNSSNNSNIYFGGKKRRKNNYNKRKNKGSSQKQLYEHSEERFIGMSLADEAGLLDHSSEQTKRAKAQVMLNRLNRVNVQSVLNSFLALNLRNEVIVELLLDVATADSEFPERNSQLGNVLDFTIRFCSQSFQFKKVLIQESLKIAEELNEKPHNRMSIGRLQSIITWLAALFAGNVITAFNFVDYSVLVIEKQSMERAIEILRTGLFVAGRCLDERCKELGEPLFEYLQTNKSSRGHLKFLVSELFILRNSGWDHSVVNRFQKKKPGALEIKRSTSIPSSMFTMSNSISNPSASQPISAVSEMSSMSSTNSISSFSELQLSDSPSLSKIVEMTAIDDIESRFMNNCTDPPDNLGINDAFKICFSLFRKHFHSANGFASFTAKMTMKIVDNYITNNGNNCMTNNMVNEIDNKKAIIKDSISTEMKYFESLVQDEENPTLWLTAFSVLAFFYIEKMIDLEFIIQKYIEIPEKCFKPKKTSIINTIADITGAPINEIDTAFQMLKKNDVEERNFDLIDSLICLCEPLEDRENINSEIAAGVFIRDLFDDAFKDETPQIIETFEPNKAKIEELKMKFGDIIIRFISNNLDYCQFDEEQLAKTREYFEIGV